VDCYNLLNIAVYIIFVLSVSLCTRSSATAEIAHVGTPFKVVQGHWFWYQSKAHLRLHISEYKIMSCLRQTDLIEA